MHTLSNKEALRLKQDAIGAQIQSIGLLDRRLGVEEQLSLMVENYNHLVEEINLLEEKPRFDPMERLPEEVWLTVLKEAVTRKSHSSFFMSTELVLFLTGVSSKWRNFIESMPSLWSDIVLDDNLEDLGMKVTIALLFSCDAPLTVQFVGPMFCWDEIQSVLLPHKGRIRSMYLVGGGVGDPFEKFFFSTVPQLCTPQLWSIDWIQYSAITGLLREIFLSPQSEHIHSISGIPFTKDILYLPSIRNLRELSTQEDAKRVLEISENLPHLEKVKLIFTYLIDKESRGIPLTVTPLNWTSLDYSQGVMETLTSLLSRLHLLRDLTVQITCDELSDLVLSMQHLKALHRLQITLWDIPSQTFVVPVTTAPLVHVQNFIFQDDRELSDDTGLEALSQVSNAFLTLMPNVETLEISACYNNPILYSLASEVGFQKAHTLILNLTQSDGPLPSGILNLSKAVKTLKLGFDDLIEIITPGVENLEVDVLDLRRAGGPYSVVQKLSFIHFEGSPSNFLQFTCLTNVFLGGNETVTRFCVVIAASPDTCTALHTVSFTRFPDLDILFIMLERRNINSPPERARIRSLGLPKRLPLSSFRTVRALLRGRIVQRQSNFEVSVQANIDIFMDPSIPGCTSCHRAHIFCSTLNYLVWPGSGKTVPSTRPYPATVEEILSTWATRSLETFILDVRRSSCGKGEDLIHITEDSLEWPVEREEIDVASQVKLDFYS